MQILNGEKITLGTCYYPEHWDEALWREDLSRMLACGIEVVRIAEFAWNKIEPAEGVYSYDFFDRFLDVAEEAGMKVIMGTPTATPPAWLTEKYPECLNAGIDGTLYRHGLRRHYNYNSPVYRKMCGNIVEHMADHYAGRSCVIGWQIDNELNCEANEYYSESDTAAFRGYLQKKYGSLEKLNEAWGAVFWNQTYTDWKEVYVPRPTVSGGVNPHQTLDYLRFISESTNEFARLQADIIRKYIKEGDFITTNGLFGHVDYQKMARESIDFITYDSYPNFAYDLNIYSDRDEMKDRKWSRNLAETRAVSRIFGIMEQQSGAGGWNSRMMQPAPKRGQMTLWTMQSIAHGADFISYFRWRTCTFGTEIYWHGILDYSGRDNRRLKEVGDIYKKVTAVSEIAGGEYEAGVGVIRDYDNIFDAEYDKLHEKIEKQSQRALFETMQKTHTPMDYVYLTERTKAEDLRKYRILFYPHPSILSNEQAAVLEDYAQKGGILVFGCRSAYKDINGKCTMEKLPGVIAGLTGADIPEYTVIAPDAGEVTVKWGEEIFPAAVFTDLVEPLTGVQEALYISGDDAGAGALVSRKAGEGKVYYYGSAFTEGAVRAFLKEACAENPYAGFIRIPEKCEIAVRVKEGVKYIFVLNYINAPANITVLEPMLDMYTGKEVSGPLTLDGYGTMVLRVRPVCDMM